MLSKSQQETKDRYCELSGSWNSEWDSVLSQDELFFEAFLDFYSVPRQSGLLDAKSRELICIAVDAAVTNLHEPGIRWHVRAALECGATEAEIKAVVELTSTLGIHAINLSLPVLVEVMEKKGLRSGTPPLDRRRSELKKDFEARRGYWRSMWDELLELGPDLFEKYTRFSALPGNGAALEPKLRELVALAVNASATHMYLPGVRMHVEGALAQGAEVGEIVDALALASGIGFHSATEAFRVLAEEVERTGEATSSTNAEEKIIR